MTAGKPRSLRNAAGEAFGITTRYPSVNRALSFLKDAGYSLKFKNAVDGNVNIMLINRRLHELASISYPEKPGTGGLPVIRRGPATALESEMTVRQFMKNREIPLFIAGLKAG